jgi:predicted nucleic acid-binding protein
MQTAVLDACGLIRNGVRDFLLWVAEAGAFTPIWSDPIHDEWMRNRRAKFGDPMGSIIRARTLMEIAFPGANFAPDPAALQTIQLPDPNDVHVVATAVAAEAETIVTYNISDFPGDALAAAGLRKETPDVFCARIFSDVEADFIEGARLHRASLKRPSYDPGPYLNYVATKLELVLTAALLRPFQDDL